MPIAAEIRDGETSALKFFRLHPLVARAMREIFRRSLISRSDLFCAPRITGVSKSVVNRDRDAEIDIGVLNDRVAIEGGVHFRNFRPRP